MGSEQIPITHPIVVMGVSGSGKSTVGAALAERLTRPFVDADDLHPAGNKAKMAAGIPLDDDDRAPWLDQVAARLAADAGNGAPIVACSALRRVYRDVLRAAAPDTQFLLLEVDAPTLRARLGDRVHEFMPVSLLASQLATLEALADDERGVTIDARQSLANLVETLAVEARAHTSHEVLR